MLKKLEKILMPIANYLGKNKILVSLRDGFMFATPVIIVGSIFLLIVNFPIENWSEIVAKVFGEGWEEYFEAVSSASFDMISIFSAIGIAYSYANQNDVNPLMAGGVSLTSYIIITPTIHELFVNADGRAFNGLSFGNIGSKGIFTSMVVALISSFIFIKTVKKGWVIKLPDAVPPAVSASFAALIPSAIIIILFFFIRIVFSLTPYGTAQNFVYQVLQTPLAGLGRSFGFEMTYQFLSTLFWFFGINGPAVTNTVFGPISSLMTQENREAYMAGKELPNIFTASFGDFFGNYGGGGSTLSLVILMLTVCKSQRIKQLARLSIVPGIFGINEPIIFGLPVVLNPIIAIPFITVPVLNIFLAQLATMAGIIPRTNGLAIPWTTPIFISGFLATNSIRASFFQLGLLAMGCLIYLPFIMTLDKEYLREEAKGNGGRDEIDEISFDDIEIE